MRVTLSLTLSNQLALRVHHAQLIVLYDNASGRYGR